MIALFTDFGLHGPYTGQMKAMLYNLAQGVPVVDLFADAPACDPRASSYLLAAHAAWFPERTVFLCVVDPAVGGDRPVLVVEADSRWYVGPGNGLFEIVRRRAQATRTYEIEWRPQQYSNTFHGRDVFAPIAALLARGERPPGRRRDDEVDRRPDWPDDLPEIVYLDHFGNAMTGMRADVLKQAGLSAAGRVFERARTFGDRPPGEAFWYENSNGLAEIAVNQGRADRDLGLSIGAPLAIVS